MWNLKEEPGEWPHACCPSIIKGLHVEIGRRALLVDEIHILISHGRKQCALETFALCVLSFRLVLSNLSQANLYRIRKVRWIRLE